MLQNHKIIKTISISQMAEVYLAIKSSSLGFKRLCIIKTIPSKLTDQPEVTKQLQNEAHILAGIYHPNIVQALDFIEEGKKYYLVLEYIPGISLKALLTFLKETKLHLNLETCCGLIQQILSAVQHFHQIDSLIHRDISPSNILIDHFGQAKLCDFGVSKYTQSDHQTQIGTLKGKLRYSAPEYIEHGRLDTRADLFSIGTCLWELIYNHPLFESKSTYDLINSIQSGSYFKKLNSKNIPSNLKQILTRALEPSPENRFQTASEFNTALSQFSEKNSFNLGHLAKLLQEKKMKQAQDHLRSEQPNISSNSHSPSKSNSPPIKKAKNKPKKLTKLLTNLITLPFLAIAYVFRKLRLI